MTTVVKISVQIELFDVFASYFCDFLHLDSKGVKCDVLQPSIKNQSINKSISTFVWRRNKKFSVAPPSCRHIQTTKFLVHLQIVLALS